MIAFELRKIWRSKKTILFLFVMLLANGLLFFFDIKEETLYRGNYKNYYTEVLKEEHKERWLQEESDKINFYKNYTFYVEGISSDHNGLQRYLDTYGKDWVQQRIEEIQKQHIDSEAYDFKQKTIQTIGLELESSDGYKVWKDDIIKRAQEQESISIFKTKESTNKINQRIHEKYQDLDVGKVSSQPAEAIQKLLTYTPIDLLMLMVIVYIVLHTIYKEKESGFLFFTMSTPHGMKKQFFSKAIALCILTCILALMMFVECYFIASMAYGFVDLSAPVQSISFLVTTPYSLSILQYLIIYAMLMTLCFCVFTLFATFIAYFSNSFVVLLASLFLLYGSSFFLYNEYDALSQFSILHTFNLYTLLHPMYLIGDYNFYVVGNWIFLHIYTILLIPIISLLCCFLGYLYYQKVNTSHHKLHIFIPTVFHAKAGSLAYQEFRKLMIKEKGILALLLVIGISSISVTQQSDCTTIHDMYYNQYISSIGQYVSKDNDIKLQETEQNFQVLEQQLQLAKTDSEKIAVSRKLDSYSAFDMYQQAYHNRKQTDIKRELLKEDHYRMFYMDSAVTKGCYTLLFLCLLLMLVQSYHREKRYGMLLIQNSSQSRHKVIKLKTAYIVMVACFLSSFIFGIQIIKILELYPNASLSVQVNAIDLFYNSGIYIPLWGYLILIAFAQLILLLGFVILMSAILRKWNHRSFVVLLGFLIMIVPVLLPEQFQVHGITFMYRMFYPHAWLANGYELYAISIVFILLGCLLYSFIKFKKQEK